MHALSGTLRQNVYWHLSKLASDNSVQQKIRTLTCRKLSKTFAKTEGHSHTLDRPTAIVRQSLDGWTDSEAYGNGVCRVLPAEIDKLIFLQQKS